MDSIVIMIYTVNMVWTAGPPAPRPAPRPRPLAGANGTTTAESRDSAPRRACGSVRGDRSRRLDVLGVLLAVTIAVATALAFAANSPAQLPGAPYSDVVMRILGGR